MSSKNKSYEEEKIFKEEYTNEEAGSPASVETMEEPKSNNGTGIIVNASFVKIRKEPSSDGEVIDTLAKGERVEIIGEEGTFKAVNYKGDIGYISSNYCMEV